MVYLISDTRQLGKDEPYKGPNTISVAVVLMTSTCTHRIESPLSSRETVCTHCHKVLLHNYSNVCTSMCVRQCVYVGCYSVPRFEANIYYKYVGILLLTRISANLYRE